MLRSYAPAEHVTPYDRFAFSDAQATRWLGRGMHRPLLRDFFGPAEYDTLAALARRVQARRRAPRAAGGLRVLVLPGILGSQLGLLRTVPQPPDILWLDPLDIQAGRLAALRLPPVAPIVPLGAMLWSHLRLALTLRARGLAVELHHYDWRAPVVTAGQALAARLRAEPRTRFALVAHSLGGLVARAALAEPGTGHVEQVVLLGTPNCGSFAAVQALRGTYPVVRRVAQLVADDTAAGLAARIFGTFPSLYDLLPHGACAGGLDLYAAGSWPECAPRPRPALLAQARATRARLAPADGRYTAIAGTGLATVTAARRRRRGFLYTVTRAGDGTVPAASATLAGARCLYVHAAHSELTRDPRVTAAVADLLTRGSTRRLARAWRTRSRAQGQIGDAQLARLDAGKIDWAALGAAERREFLVQLNEPPPLPLRVPRREGSGRGVTTRPPRRGSGAPRSR